MGGSVWIELLKMMPSWFFTIAAFIILGAMAGSLWWLLLGAKRFSDALGRETRLLDLQDELKKEREQKKEFEIVSSQLHIAMENLQILQNDLNKLREMQDKEDPELIEIQARNLVQRAVENLASDIKRLPGERHRCGLWFEQDGKLVLYFASSGFPNHYLNHRSLMSVNRSQEIVLGEKKRLNPTM